MQERFSSIGDLTLRYVRSGNGSRTVVLVHGWPQSSYAWRRVMPLLARRYTVVAIDLRGVGGSSAPAGGYDKQTLAADVKALIDRLNLHDVIVVGHDIGAMVAYAYARSYPDETAGAVLVDMPVPGAAGWAAAEAAFPSWHLGFYRDVNHKIGVAETLIAGHEDFYFRSFIDRFAAHPGRISDADVSVYAAAYAGPGRLKAGFEMFRMIPVDVHTNEFDAAYLPVPFLLAFAEHSYGTLLGPVAQGLKELGIGDVRTTIVRDSGHWPAEEQPQNLYVSIREFIDSLS